MSIRNQLCEVVLSLKDSQGLSYNDIISLCKESDVSLSRPQLSYILCHRGKNISVELIEQVIGVFKGELSITYTHKRYEDF